MKSIRQKATEASQYDNGEVQWSQSDTLKRIFIENLGPYLNGVGGKKVLDIGCGQGWLSDYIHGLGGKVLGIDPSIKNIQSAKSQYPSEDFVNVSLQGLKSSQQFDVVTALMVFEHLLDPKEAYSKIKSLLKPDGYMLLITGDFDIFSNSRRNYRVEKKVIRVDEIATMTDYGEDLGIIYDINRKSERIISLAEESGLKLIDHRSIPAPEWLIREHIGYEAYGDKGQPLFHLFQFSVK